VKDKKLKVSKAYILGENSFGIVYGIWRGLILHRGNYARKYDN
jgi:hypothetical protein